MRYKDITQKYKFTREFKARFHKWLHKRFIPTPTHRAWFRMRRHACMEVDAWSAAYNRLVRHNG